MPYPWKDLDVLTNDDLNAGFAVAYANAAAALALAQQAIALAQTIEPRNQGQMLAQFVLGTIVNNGTFNFTYRAPYSGVIASLDSFAATGTFTLAVAIAGNPVAGLSAVAVNSAPTNTVPTNTYTFTAGQTITGTISSATGLPTNAVLSLNVTWS